MQQAEFDYVIIGGGSAGCVLAGRLSEDPNVSVCLLESGGDGNNWIVNTPAAAILSISTKLNNWAFNTTPQAGLNGRLGYQPRGKGLGGSSNINAMVYIRGHRQDYDRWAALGNTGWSYDEVLPYFKKSEHNERINNKYHGQGGPLNVCDLRSDSVLQQVYVQAAKEADYPLNDDFNGAEQEGLGVYQVTQINGERCSAARAFLLPHLGKRPNLQVETFAHVQRIIIEDGCAVGVEFKQQKQLKIIRAKCEVLLSAGTFQSPHILMLSGIGDKTELEQHGIKVVHHLPGVGKNLHDHPDFIFGYKVRQTQGTFGLSVGGSFDLLKQIGNYRKNRRGMITTNFAECGGFLKTNPELSIPNLQLHFVIALVDNHGRTLHRGHGISCHVCLLNPRSRGSVKLSGGHIDDPLQIDLNFLHDSQDMQDMVAGFKMTKKLMDTPAFRAIIQQDVFCNHVQTDEDIRELLCQRVDTVYHPVGTCKMGIDEMAVVDPELKVYGIKGLRVVDASIMPTVVNGNTNAPTIMIAEKAVDLIRQSNQAQAIDCATTESAAMA
ncbi:GMC family oxidoreductase [Alkanindiges sp. WGS2144]|uniref:GMC family oxidoreductase n=1 Tax=Alkanindiges sp. WGS2144 TaxID=3366808 RepID=UPI003753041C